MSHELRTPLAAILGYAELMQEGFYEPHGPKSLDALTRICSNGKHLLGLIMMTRSAYQMIAQSALAIAALRL